jgi:peptide/nickel transport system ATP-binding protein
MNRAVDVGSLRVEIAASGADIVDNVTFSIDRGEILGLVGESGSGKTTVGLALLGYASRGTRIAAGRVLIDGIDVLSLDRESLRDLRGRIVAYVPQDPSTALNPALRIGRQLTEMFDFHGRVGSRTAREDRARSALAEVGLPTDDEFLQRWPHQLSGGQQQRVCLAMAFLLKPRVIVLDEPTTGLDVVTQAQVLDIVRELCRAHGSAALYVTHDLAVVRTLANRVVVMYSGRLVS